MAGGEVISQSDEETWDDQKHKPKRSDPRI